MTAPPPPAIVQPAACTAPARGERCGYVRVPLDHGHPGAGHIRVYFELYRATDTRRPPLSTVLSIEGGPGYSTTADRDARLTLWRPISRRRNLLLVDLRGTGRSGALRCRAFADHILGYVRRAGACARELGRRARFYDTSQSVQDLESVLSALGAGKVDLYGDSYGSYAAQAFALRYPGRLRSLVLDSTYPLPGSDPAWAELAAATRRALRLSCRRVASCPTTAPVAELARLVRRVRRDPIVGRAPNGDGVMTRVVVDEDALVQTLQDGYAYLGVYRDLPAAIRSAEHGDDEPLLRLVAENEIADGPSYPADFSEALYLAVTCHDYPQLWPAGTPLAERAAAARRRLDRYPPGAFAPFSPAAWTGTDYEGVMACLRWPDSPARSDPPLPPGAAYPRVPTLVLVGDLDNITPTADNRIVARRFPHSTLVQVRNVNHVQALFDTAGCASAIYQRFVRRLATGDTSCTRRVPPVRVVARFPLTLAGMAPALPSPGDRSTLPDRRLAAAAAATVADVLERWWVNYSGSDRGLRGGRWSYAGDRTTVFTLHGVAGVPGVAVSGSVRWQTIAGGVAARVTVRAPGGARAALALHWSMRGPAAQARIRGWAGGRPLRAHMLAP